LALREEKSYEALLKERILEPLKMNDTGITLPEDQKKRLAQGHNQGMEPVENWDIPTLAGAGALRSTVNDMLVFLAANLGLIRCNIRKPMEMTHDARIETGIPDLFMGLGWHIFKKHGSEIIWHNGGTGGYRTFAGFDKKNRMGVVVLSNSANSQDDIGFHLLNPGYPLAKLSMPKKEITLSRETLTHYVGKYELAPGAVFTLTLEENRLFAQLTGQQKYRVYPEEKNIFFYKVAKARLVFHQDEKGEVTHLVLHQGGMEQKADKIE
jgi:hypothetical protein